MPTIERAVHMDGESGGLVTLTSLGGFRVRVAVSIYSCEEAGAASAVAAHLEPDHAELKESAESRT